MGLANTSLLARRALVSVVVAAVWALAALPVVAGIPCPVAELGGFACPGCGVTRALVLVAHGHVAAAVRLHPLAVPLVLATAYFAASTVVLAWRDAAPLAFLDRRAGHFALGAYAGVMGCAALLWLMRLVGLFGGPVPI